MIFISKQLTSSIEIVRVHEGDGLVTVGALLCVAFIHGVHHHCHLLPCAAAQGLLTLLCKFPLFKDKEIIQ